MKTAGLRCGSVSLRYSAGGMPHPLAKAVLKKLLETKPHLTAISSILTSELSSGTLASSFLVF